MEAVFLFNLKSFTSANVYLESLEMIAEWVLQGLDLCWDDGQHRHINAVKFIKTAPGSTLRQTREDFANGLET